MRGTIIISFYVFLNTAGNTSVTQSNITHTTLSSVGYVRLLECQSPNFLASMKISFISLIFWLAWNVCLCQAVALHCMLHYRHFTWATLCISWTDFCFCLAFIVMWMDFVLHKFHPFICLWLIDRELQINMSPWNRTRGRGKRRMGNRGLALQNTR